ncbi:hypothetical protein TRFO_08976 [Tritrichomonas foetus]|uniref:EF hand family protein n=1 Tax=Tritrichomonas foetus TaxID=1144522 RepID=A0A1J4JI56_9EUKA|nr:hypothetical protein TRFO_08976 [Tritrichomonas foetus]|eukprot:OHS98377.1 hypothetical protein TRFO_08976 [Tritrichomonas foetus]
MKKWFHSVLKHDNSIPHSKGIDIEKAKLVELSVKFNEIDTDNNKSLDQIEFLSFMAQNMPALSPFSTLIFDVFSDGKNPSIDFRSFIQFYTSCSLVDEDPGSLPNIIFSYYDKKKKGYLDINCLRNVGKSLYKNRSNFTKEDAEKMLYSQNPANPKNGLSRQEFANLFKTFLVTPIKDGSPSRSLNSKQDARYSTLPISNSVSNSTKLNSNESSNLNSDFNLNIDTNIKSSNLNRQKLSRGKISSPSSFNRKSGDFQLINKVSISEDILHSTSLEAYKAQFQQFNINKRSVITEKQLGQLVNEYCLIPQNFVFITMKIFGKNGFLSFQGYCSFRKSLLLEVESEESYSHKVFNLFSGDDGLIQLQQAREFGNLIKLKGKANSIQRWNSIINEVRYIYQVNGICFETFSALMYSMSTT